MSVILGVERQRQEDQEFKAKPGLHSNFEASLGYIRLCLENKIKMIQVI